MAGIKPFSQACVNNRQPILGILQRVYATATRVLEIGSGTGQHCVYFAPALPHLCWQPSDRQENLAGIHAWLEEYPAANLYHPLELDVEGPWPAHRYDAFFTANTCHIMPWQSVVRMFSGIGEVAEEEATLALYGPFKYGGQYTSRSNANFDNWLQAQAPHQGIRDVEDIVLLAREAGFRLVEDNPMPANNQLLVFSKRRGG